MSPISQSAGRRNARGARRFGNLRYSPDQIGRGLRYFRGCEISGLARPRSAGLLRRQRAFDRLRYFRRVRGGFRLEAPEKLPAISIPPEVRHNIFLAFKESVNNVVKHAHATAVKVRVRLAPDRFVLEIEDNGRGVVEADKAKGRNGLRNMARRMEDVGGEFSLEPGAQGGTLVRLTAPIAETTS